ncbi:MAG: hypothetical protein IJV06_04770 [Bacteroidaceae bacterium]|nr:hypothetical protein [Bacteroidaceae bacterium]
MKNVNLLLAALAGLVLVGCSSDYVDDAASSSNSAGSNAIAFGSGLKATTRANEHYGFDAAKMLNYKFVVGGFKGTGNADNPATTTVFDNYLVQWTENTAGATQSNTSDWDYVGFDPASTSSLPSGSKQTIKFWDYSADQYDFIAYSTGEATGITASAIDAANAKTAAFTLKGTSDQLQKCYIADMVTVYKNSTTSPKYQDEVQLVFRSLASKVRIALYETVPGYSVKDVKFYTNNTATLGSATETKATLFTASTGATKDNFFTSGTYTISYPTIGKTNINNSDYNQAHVAFAPETIGGTSTTSDQGALIYQAKESNEKTTDNVFLGRSSSNPSWAGIAEKNYYTIVLPNEEGTVLEIRIDYTLESVDGSGEEIHVYGAKAFVPAVYATWKSNYAYTYIFKISDNSNGWTSKTDTDPAGLYPITFDAVVVDSEDGMQSTITTVAAPSITTYQKGHDLTKDEYAAGDIYVQVMTGGTLKDDLATKGQLWTVTGSTPISEATVMDALNIRASTSGGVVTGRNGLTLTPASFDATVTAIPSVDGNNISVNAGEAAKFTASAGTYAYTYKVSNKGDTKFTTAVKLDSQPTDWPTGYFTDKDGTTSVTSFTAGTTYYKKYTNLNIVYGVKVIKVQ